MRETPRSQGTAGDAEPALPQLRPGCALAHTTGASGSGSPHRSDGRPPQTPRGERHTGRHGGPGTTPPVPGPPSVFFRHTALRALVLPTVLLAVFALCAWQVAAHGPLRTFDERLGRAIAGSPLPLLRRGVLRRPRQYEGGASGPRRRARLHGMAYPGSGTPVVAGAAGRRAGDGGGPGPGRTAEGAARPPGSARAAGGRDRVLPFRPCRDGRRRLWRGSRAAAPPPAREAAGVADRRRRPAHLAVGVGLVRRAYHWPLDVVGSWCLCGCLLWAVLRVRERSGRRTA
ncbi:putative membrane protein [Streptomyces himastatinicus ATCC 53653]|uniref:Putative membrane protein n=1 Tax=Streptomyces himastatinicus ATCC 53653 TaxID=457427 RepID=D9WB99_9ACTN|nr:putative membrane protein [Streptomyces himastatinicus ATCC 53653]